MRIYKTIISNNEPSQRDVIWAKPNESGFTFYLLDGGKWKPVKVVDDKGTVATKDDVVVAVEDKVNKIKSPTQGNVVIADSKGGIACSLYKPSDFATAAQGTKANTAVQNVYVNNVLIEKNADNEVNLEITSGGNLPIYNYSNPPASPTLGDVCFSPDAYIDSVNNAGIPLYYNGTSWVTAVGTAPNWNIK